MAALELLGFFLFKYNARIAAKSIHIIVFNSVLERFHLLRYQHEVKGDQTEHVCVCHI
jgi:hypothetical protein